MKAYLRRHIYVIIAVCCAAASFVAVFSLYALPWEPLVYAVAISAFCFLVIGGLRFVAFRKKHRELLRLRDSVASALDTLPPAENLIEADYQALIALLDESRRTLVTETDRLRSDAADYYSLWAHQIKTPIAAARLLLQSDENRELEREVARQLLSIEQYVDMVLGYQRIESPSSDLVIGENSLDEIVKQAARKLSRLFIHEKIGLEIAEGLPSVLTDGKWLGFVIEQIFTNSIKYAPGGRVFVYMEDGETLVIRDNGIGIAAEDLPRVFEKGYTGYNGRIGQKSTGIGLYLCKMTLDRLSHTIALESAPGKGTAARIGFHTANINAYTV